MVQRSSLSALSLPCALILHFHMSSDKNACLQVMAIQELLDILCSFLDNASLKTLSLCCKEWHE